MFGFRAWATMLFFCCCVALESELGVYLEDRGRSRISGSFQDSYFRLTLVREDPEASKDEGPRENPSRV